MSADNWTICPRCAARENERLAEAEKAVADAYGKIPVAEFDAKRQEARRRDLEFTLREDYHIGIYPSTDGGFKFEIGYAAGCTACGFDHDFKHSVPMEANP